MAPRRCSVLNCPNVTGKRKGETHFFRFPQVEVFARKWIESTGRNNWVPNESNRICSLHFRKEDFTASKKRLKPNVMPTLHIHSTPDIRQNISHEEYDHIQEKNLDNIKTELKDIVDCTYLSTYLEDDIKTELEDMIDCAHTEIEDTKDQKRKAENLLQQAQSKIEKLEKENNQMKTVIRNWEEKYTNQENKLQSFFKQQKKLLQEELAIKNKQLKVLQNQIKRKDSKIKELLTKAL